jgi:hypothetical protein
LFFFDTKDSGRVFRGSGIGEGDINAASCNDDFVSAMAGGVSVMVNVKVVFLGFEPREEFRRFIVSVLPFKCAGKLLWS